jgi:hypothetical protein
MNRKLQRARLELATKWLDIIEICEKNIEAGNNVRYFRSVKQEAAERYAEAEAMIVQPTIIEANKLNLVEG